MITLKLFTPLSRVSGILMLTILCGYLFQFKFIANYISILLQWMRFISASEFRTTELPLSTACTFYIFRRDAPHPQLADDSLNVYLSEHTCFVFRSRLKI